MPAIKQQRQFLGPEIAVLFLLVCAGMIFGQSTWELRSPLPQGHTLNLVTYASGKFVAVGEADPIMMSTDGATWVPETSGTAASLSSVTYGSNKFMAVGSGGVVLTSTNGKTWSRGNSGTTSWLNSVTYGNGLFVAAGLGGINNCGTVQTSLDGITWTAKEFLAFSCLHSVAYGNGRFVAVGEVGTILSSTDGATWDTTIVGGAGNVILRSVTYGNNRFVVAGDGGRILSSLDGKAWTSQDPGPIGSIYFVTYGNGQFLALGGSGIMTSPDATTWTIRSPLTGYVLSSVTYGDSQYVAVGAGGTILISKDDITGIASQTAINSNAWNRLRITIANNQISGFLPNLTYAAQRKVALFTVAGRMVYSAAISANSGTIMIPASGFPADRYLMSITDGRNRTQSSSFVLIR